MKTVVVENLAAVIEALPVHVRQHVLDGDWAALVDVEVVRHRVEGRGRDGLDCQGVALALAGCASGSVSVGMGFDGCVRVGGTDFDRDLNLASVMPLLGYRSAMKRPGLLTPNHYFTDLASWSKINFLYVPSVMAEIRQIARERLARATRLVEQSGHELVVAIDAALTLLVGHRGPLGLLSSLGHRD
jgi:hypothetical protein